MPETCWVLWQNKFWMFEVSRWLFYTKNTIGLFAHELKICPSEFLFINITCYVMIQEGCPDYPFFFIYSDSGLDCLGILTTHCISTKANQCCLFLVQQPQWASASSFTRFLDHTQLRTTVGRTPLDEWSARRRDLYLTTHNTHNRKTSMPPVGFEPTTSAGERLQTYALDRAATGTGKAKQCESILLSLF